jgi:DNA-binding MarR family transcriptional regulator
MVEGQEGFRFVFLLGGAFRTMIDHLHDDLAASEHADARPMHGFALQAIGPRGCSISALGERLGVSKQAAAKTAAGLETAGYIVRESDPADARATRLVRTTRATELLTLSAASFERQMNVWRAELGDDRVAVAFEVLEQIAGSVPLSDLPGWLTR